MNEILIDETQVSNLKELFNEGFEDFVHSYFQDVQEKEQQLILAIENKHLEESRKIAHALKGSSLNMGAIGIANVCDKIEVASKAGSHTEVLEEFNRFKELCPGVKKEYLRAALS